MLAVAAAWRRLPERAERDVVTQASWGIRVPRRCSAIYFRSSAVGGSTLSVGQFYIEKLAAERNLVRCRLPGTKRCSGRAHFTKEEISNERKAIDNSPTSHLAAAAAQLWCRLCAE